MNYSDLNIDWSLVDLGSLITNYRNPEEEKTL
jgi:hypothetical protein